MWKFDIEIEGSLNTRRNGNRVGKLEGVLGSKDPETIKFVQDKEWGNIFQNKTADNWIITRVSGFKGGDFRDQRSQQRKCPFFFHGSKVKN